MRQPAESGSTVRERRPELIRPAERRKTFTEREAQRRLQKKEGRWTLVAYAVALSAVAVVLFFAYSSYAFSKYRGVILPGVQVDQVKLSGLTEKQARDLLTSRFVAIHQQPLSLVYLGHVWTPQESEYGLSYQFDTTARAAIGVGRTGPFWQQWIDRLPFHFIHDVSMVWTLDTPRLRDYITSNIAGGRGGLSQAPRDAALALDAAHKYRLVLLPSRPGTKLDDAAAEQQIHDALGGLSTQVVHLKVNHVAPAIGDADALRVGRQVNRFLDHTPVIALGKRVVVTSRASFGPMISFNDVVAHAHPAIQVSFDTTKLHAFIASLAAQVDRAPQEAKLLFDASQVQVISPQHNGRTLNQDAAFRALLPVVQGLKPNARLHFPIIVTTPPIDQSNPASLGITTPLGFGESSFSGANPVRLSDVQAIAKALNQDLLPAKADISFNTLIGANWPNRVYNDHLQEIDGQLVPGNGGAMQQVATAFLRALYSSGLALEERHAHVYRLPFYEPPVGLDAVVAPGRNWDLRFANTTNKTLLIQTVVQPLRQEVYVYVYGPKLGWNVKMRSTVRKIYPHGAQIERQDPALAPGVVQQIAWPLDGADVVVHRTITHPNGTVEHDSISTHYRPSEAIITVGSQAATPTPTTKKHATVGKATVTPTAGASPTASSSPSPTATFSH